MAKLTKIVGVSLIVVTLAKLGMVFVLPNGFGLDAGWVLFPPGAELAWAYRLNGLISVAFEILAGVGLGLLLLTIASKTEGQR